MHDVPRIVSATKNYRLSSVYDLHLFGCADIPQAASFVLPLMWFSNTLYIRVEAFTVLFCVFFECCAKCFENFSYCKGEEKVAREFLAKNYYSTDLFFCWLSLSKQQIFYKSFFVCDWLFFCSSVSVNNYGGVLFGKNQKDEFCAKRLWWHLHSVLTILIGGLKTEEKKQTPKRRAKK